MKDSYSCFVLVLLLLEQSANPFPFNPIWSASLLKCHQTPHNIYSHIDPDDGSFLLGAVDTSFLRPYLYVI